jgi:23S rRNA G2445 N2-methylase RlmL
LVRCKRIGKHKFNSLEIEKLIGEIIHNQNHNVNLKEPETVIYADIINNTFFLGILLKKGLCKRDYRIRINPASINACIAYSLIKIAQPEKQDIILDPFCKDGIIPIETYLSGYKKIKGSDENYFSIKNSRINAKLAKARITFSHYGIDWLDTKIKKHSINKIITAPPFESKSKNIEDIKKLYKEFFYQASYILKKQGTITILTPKPELIIKIAKENNYKIIKKRKIIKGMGVYYILIFKKTK